MMLLTTKLLMTSSMLTVLFLVVLAPSALADTATQPSPQVADLLADFKRTTFEMRGEADTLKSFTPNKRLHWQSHAHRLDALKNHVNDMGKSLAELEALKPTATESQGIAIEHARPHLVSVAQNLTQAIELVREKRNNIHWAEYGEAVSNIYAHADALHTKLDTILDYENAKVRFDSLELQPTSTEGS
jgi:hypothetical protein